MADKVLHGALAIIRRNGTAIGKMKNVRWTETLRDQEVRGLGTIFTLESPVVSHGGTLTCDFYEVDFAKTGVPGAIRRDVQTNQEFEDQILLRDGLQLDIFKKVEDLVDPNTGLKTAKAIPYAVIRELYLNSEGADISEGAISGHNQSFRFNAPVIFPV
jgi:hypothetical protein